ncbi:MAG: NAD(P)/FAD-dependent oxidoreductase [Ruminococcus sp.]|jgi:NADPH-dependent 2,4-dienoyl-CoA reductase/sulfur reductase-like enzyme|nr:NAD(P)/FAD-dependent oxidoreductase [Ruminococcus sp.]
MNYVIIGNSAAAIGAVQGIRQNDKTGGITIISDETYHTYSRPLISYWLKGAVTEQNIRYRDFDFYKENNVETKFGVSAVSFDPDAKTVELSDGSTVSYDKLLIATGSKPFCPPTEGYETVKKSFTFMKFDDAKAVKEALFPGAKVLIVGAGLIGLKAAEAVHEYTENITVIDLADRILSSILDEDAASIMKKHIEGKGVNFKLGTSVSKYTENSALLSNGDTIDFDILITAVGVRPNTELVKNAGGKVNRGIVTDKTQAVLELKDVYAAGDCTESIDVTTNESKILALLPNAFLQGEVAGKNMAGEYIYYVNAIPMNAIGFFGLHIITAGTYDGDEFVTVSGENYKKLVIRDGFLKGYILMGEVDRAGIYTSLIKERIGIEDCDFDMLKKSPQMAAFARIRRDKKLAEFH